MGEHKTRPYMGCEEGKAGGRVSYIVGPLGRVSSDHRCDHDETITVRNTAGCGGDKSHALMQRLWIKLYGNEWQRKNTNGEDDIEIVQQLGEPLTNTVENAYWDGIKESEGPGKPYGWTLTIDGMRARMKRTKKTKPHGEKQWKKKKARKKKKQKYVNPALTSSHQYKPEGEVSGNEASGSHIAHVHLRSLPAREKNMCACISWRCTIPPRFHL